MRRILPSLLLLAACGGGAVDNFGTETKTFDPFDTLVVVGETGRVELQAGSADSIEVTYLQGGTHEGWQDREEGGALVIEATCSDGEIGCSASFVIVLPADTAVEAVTTEGQIAIEGMAGELTLQTTSGPIEGDGLGEALVSILTNATVELAFDDAPEGVTIDGGRDPITLTVPAGGYALDLDAGGDLELGSGIDDDPSGPPLVLECASDITVTTAG